MHLEFFIFQKYGYKVAFASTLEFALNFQKCLHPKQKSNVEFLKLTH